MQKMCDGSGLHTSGGAAGFLEDFEGPVSRALTVTMYYRKATPHRGLVPLSPRVTTQFRKAPPHRGLAPPFIAGLTRDL